MGNRKYMCREPWQKDGGGTKKKNEESLFSKENRLLYCLFGISFSKTLKIKRQLF